MALLDAREIEELDIISEFGLPTGEMFTACVCSK